MLPTVRRVRSPRISWRAYSTSEPNNVHHESQTLSPRPAGRPFEVGASKPRRDTGDDRAKIPRASMAQKSIYVRAWNFPASMAEAFAIIRGIERRFGKIRDFKWVRDTEMPQLYQSILWASFHSTSSFDSVPKSGTTLYIPAPPVKGDVGLEELAQLLESTDRVEGEGDHEGALPKNGIMQRVLDSGNKKASEQGPKMLDVRVERALHDTVFYPEISTPQISHAKQTALSHALLDWGGFAPLKPLFGSKSPYNTDVEGAGEEEVDREKMRKMLNKASQWTKRPDPSFEVPEEKLVKPEAQREDANTGEIKWERASRRSRVKARSNHPTPEPQPEFESNDTPDLPPIRLRAWSLPTPPPDPVFSSASATDAKSQTQHQHHKHNTDAKAEAKNVAANARRQQILAKAKQVKIPQPPQQKAKTKGAQQKQPQTKESESLTIDKKSTRNQSQQGSQPDQETKGRLWNIVGKWF